MTKQTMTTPVGLRIEVKNYKSFQGMDGEAFSLSLYIDGKRAAEVSNGGSGGCNDYHWLQKSPKERGNAAMAFKDHCRAVAADEYKDYSEVEDIVLDTIIDRMLETRILKRHCRTKVLFRVKGDGEGEWRTLTAKWSERREAIRRHLDGKYGDTLEEIVNERFDAAQRQSA